MRTPWIGVLVFLIGTPLFAFADAEVESRVREYFSDTPIMIEIARCESKFRQYADSGNPLYGGMGGTMVGVFQVHSTVHQSYAQSVLGYDITTLEGNLGYAKYLYQTEGTKPWISSFPCWGAASSAESAAPVSATAISDLSANLSLGMVHPQVLVLQKMLNAKGYRIADEGPGSPGQETEKFGALTRAAVKKFQCATMQICDGDEYSTGYGFVGARTRAALAEASAAPIASNPSHDAADDDAPHSQPLVNGYTEEQNQEITRLQAQIVELTKILAELMAARSS